MKLNKLFLAMSVIGASAAMTGCGSDSDSSDPAPEAVACATVGLDEGQTLEVNGVDLPLCELRDNIAQDVTLTSDYVYRLNGYITVGSGHGELELDTEAEKTAIQDAGVTLTVEPGTHFRSSGRGSLIISRGSEIVANGTATAPIVMSSYDAGYTGQGEWGGLVLQGFAKNNECGDGATGSVAVGCDTADEAGTGFHGGNDDADSSGSISHLIVAEGGYEVAPDSEVNGITLHSVGYGTSIENVMIYGNADDGIEFFGGAANVKNIILIDNGDESLDWDNGWRGNVQFALIRQGLLNEGDHGIEADTAGPSNSALPESNPVIANATFQENAAQGADDLFRFKKGTEGTLINVAADGYEECVKAEGSDVDVTLTNVVAECGAYDTSSENFNFEYVTGGVKVDATADTPVTADDVVTADNAAVASLTFSAGVDADTFGSATVDLGNAFEVTGNNGTLAQAPAFNSANGSTNFLTATSYVGAVDPTVTDAANAWWAWAADVIPAAFQ
jgi:hypothetical protein